MSERLEEMLRIAQAGSLGEFLGTFNSRTAEALVKGMQVLADIATSSNVLAAPAKAHHAMAEFTAAMEDSSNVG